MILYWYNNIIILYHDQLIIHTYSLRIVIFQTLLSLNCFVKSTSSPCAVRCSDTIDTRYYIPGGEYSIYGDTMSGLDLTQVLQGFSKDTLKKVETHVTTADGRQVIVELESAASDKTASLYYNIFSSWSVEMQQVILIRWNS